MLHYCTLTSTTAPEPTHSQRTRSLCHPPPDPGKALPDPQQHGRQLHLPTEEGQMKEGAEIRPLRSHPVSAGSAQRFLWTAWKDFLTAHRGGTGPFAAGKPQRQRLPAPYPLPHHHHHHHPGLSSAGCRRAQPGTGRGALTPGGEPSHRAQQPCCTAGNKKPAPTANPPPQNHLPEPPRRDSRP